MPAAGEGPPGQGRMGGPQELGWRVPMEQRSCGSPSRCQRSPEMLRAGLASSTRSFSRTDPTVSRRTGVSRRSAGRVERWLPAAGQVGLTPGDAKLAPATQLAGPRAEEQRPGAEPWHGGRYRHQGVTGDPRPCHSTAGSAEGDTVLPQLHLKCCHFPVRSQASPNPVLIQSQSRTSPVQIWSGLSSIHLSIPCQAQGQQGRGPSSMSSATLLPRLRLAAPGSL